MSIIALSPSVCTCCTRWSSAMKVPVRPTPALREEGGGRERGGRREGGREGRGGGDTWPYTNTNNSCYSTARWHVTPL